MITTTRLRILRLKHGISLMELERHWSFSNQYLSVLELGKAKRTSYNEKVIGAAIAAIIESRKEDIARLEQGFETHRGHLLDTLEVESE